ncbi:GNAT family N-acetyltransferase [Thalassobaculum sp.]|uniref:GNAT family N-acetyltransferase n=1 Tax=Thalassobaculum sp. TaxID=2022740 RepID=UPI003B5AECAF
MSGPYGRRSYVESLAGDGDWAASLWGGHVLLRSVPGGDAIDAASAYPMGGFDAQTDPGAGVEAMRAVGAVSLSVVADPLNAPDAAWMARHADVHRRLKTHYVLDRDAGPFTPSKHHRYEIRRARRQVTVDRVDLAEVLPRWEHLYGHLSERHEIAAGSRLGARHFAALAGDPQALVFAARVAGEIVAMSIWLSDGEVAHNHLGASSEAGYEAGASYALYAAAIEALPDCRVLDLGGAPGFTDDPSHGLARFKRGFANAERATWLSGFILDRAAYDAAVAASGVDPSTGYFPAYRGR